ncbi:MAG: 2-C-methyl-D-erythritol 4-phosphate cytidylyltransferase, partial [Angelakisella sp.]
MRNNRKISVILLAAGSSLRFGRENKLEACICGKSVLYHAVRAFTETDYADEIILVTKADQREKLTEAYRYDHRIKVILGGESRNASSLRGIQAATGELVVIHDGARPFVNQDTILRCIDGAAQYGAVAAAMPATDTIKLCDDTGVVRQTTQRSNTWRTQSPQAFERAALLEAYQTTDPLDPAVTDDCMVMEHSGHPVRLVEGSNYNIKITTRADLTMAESIARELGWSGFPRICCAIGQDSHRTADVPSTHPMILGGVEFAEYPALQANSDGDVVLHALTNAVSGVTAENVLGARADAICQSGRKDSR